MAGRPSVFAQRKAWALLVGLAGLAFWVVSIGVGLRAWLMVDDAPYVGDGPGIVAHTDAFGRAAMPWMITGALLLLTAALMGVGTAVVRHLVDGPERPTPELETKPTKEPRTPERPKATAPSRPAEPSHPSPSSGSGADEPARPALPTSATTGSVASPSSGRDAPSSDDPADGDTTQGLRKS